jgi:hypothetical protein
MESKRVFFCHFLPIFWNQKCYFLTISANFLQSKRLFLDSFGGSFSAFQSTNLKYPKGYFLIFGTPDIKKFPKI